MHSYTTGTVVTTLHTYVATYFINGSKLAKVTVPQMSFCVDVMIIQKLILDSSKFFAYVSSYNMEQFIINISNKKLVSHYCKYEIQFNKSKSMFHN